MFVTEDFSAKRSAHYNEFLAMKEAREAGLLDDDDDEVEVKVKQEIRVEEVIEEKQDMTKEKENVRFVSYILCSDV